MTAVLLLSAGILLCLLLSAFFSASEMSFSSVNEVRMENMAEKGDRKARKVLTIIRNFEDALSSILIGNNLVNIASSSLGSVLVLLIAGRDDLSWISTVAITVLVIIFGETVPKITAKKNANRLSLRFAPAILFLMRIFRPMVLLTTSLTGFLTKNIRKEVADPSEEETAMEFSSIIETAEDEGVLSEDCSELLQAAIDFPAAAAQEVMTSRVDMEAIDIRDGIRGVMEVIEKTPYSRIPVYEDSVDNMIGILHLNRFFKALTGADSPEDIVLEDILMPPVYVYKTMDLPIVLRKMKEAKQHMAIVTDEYGGTEGILTLEDVLEEIVGEIWDETDTVEEDLRKTGENTWTVDGDMPIGDFLEEFGISEEDFPYESETVGGCVIEYLEEFPKKGDSFRAMGFHFTVESVDGLRVEKVLVTADEG